MVRSREIREKSRESGGKGQGKQPWGVGSSDVVRAHLSFAILVTRVFSAVNY